jgi:hypothetical protein
MASTTDHDAVHLLVLVAANQVAGDADELVRRIVALKPVVMQPMGMS